MNTLLEFLTTFRDNIAFICTGLAENGHLITSEETRQYVREGIAIWGEEERRLFIEACRDFLEGPAGLVTVGKILILAVVISHVFFNTDPISMLIRFVFGEHSNDPFDRIIRGDTRGGTPLQGKMEVDRLLDGSGFRERVDGEHNRKSIGRQRFGHLPGWFEEMIERGKIETEDKRLAQEEQMRRIEKDIIEQAAHAFERQIMHEETQKADSMLGKRCAMTELRRHRLHQEVITRAGLEGGMIRENVFLDAKAVHEHRAVFNDCVTNEHVKPSIIKEFNRLATDKNNIKPYMDSSYEKIEAASQEFMGDLSVGAKLKVLVGGESGDALAARANKAAYTKYVYFAIEDLRGHYHQNMQRAENRASDPTYIQIRDDFYEKRMSQELLDQQAREIEAMIERDLQEMRAMEAQEAGAGSSFSASDSSLLPPRDPMSEAIGKSIEEKAMAETEAEFQRAGGYDAGNRLQGSGAHRGEQMQKQQQMFLDQQKQEAMSKGKGYAVYSDSDSDSESDLENIKLAPGVDLEFQRLMSDPAASRKYMDTLTLEEREQVQIRDEERIDWLVKNAPEQFDKEYREAKAYAKKHNAYGQKFRKTPLCEDVDAPTTTTTTTSTTTTTDAPAPVRPKRIGG